MSQPEYYMIANLGTLQQPYMSNYPSHLVLAQLWLKSQEYRDAVLSIIARRSVCGLATNVILDNGAHEGVDMALDTYVEIAQKLKPTCIVLSDLVGRSNVASRKRSQECFQILTNIPELTNAKYMYVPQGRNDAEVLDEYRYAAGVLDPKRFIIGIGAGYLQWVEYQDMPHELARGNMMQAIATYPANRIMTYHLLGARWQSPMRLGILGQWYSGLNVVSMDTVKPCHMTLQWLQYGLDRNTVTVDHMGIHAADEHRLLRNVRILCQEYGAIYKYTLPGD